MNKEGKKLVTVNFDEKTASAMVSKPKKVSVADKVDIGCIEETSESLNDVFD